MNTELKKEIVNWIFENEKEFQITNRCTQHFRQAIYTEEGEYYLNGEEVYKFILNAIKLLVK